MNPVYVSLRLCRVRVMLSQSTGGRIACLPCVFVTYFLPLLASTSFQLGSAFHTPRRLNQVILVWLVVPYCGKARPNHEEIRD